MYLKTTNYCAASTSVTRINNYLVDFCTEYTYCTWRAIKWEYRTVLLLGRPSMKPVSAIEIATGDRVHPSDCPKGSDCLLQLADVIFE